MFLYIFLFVTVANAHVDIGTKWSYVGTNLSFKFSAKFHSTVKTMELFKVDNELTQIRSRYEIKYDRNRFHIMMSNLIPSDEGRYQLKINLTSNRTVSRLFGINVIIAKCYPEIYGGDSVKGMISISCYSSKLMTDEEWLLNGKSITEETYTKSYVSTYKLYDATVRDFVHKYVLYVTIIDFISPKNLSYSLKLTFDNSSYVFELADDLQIGSKLIRLNWGDNITMICPNSEDIWYVLYFPSSATREGWLPIPGSDNVLDLINVTEEYSGYYKCESDLFNEVRHIIVFKRNNYSLPVHRIDGYRRESILFKHKYHQR